MNRSLSFVYLDGREVEGSSPRGVLEALRDGDAAAPPHDLGRFLDLVSSRGALTFSVTLEVGEPGADLVLERVDRGVVDGNDCDLAVTAEIDAGVDIAHVAPRARCRAGESSPTGSRDEGLESE